MSGLAWLVTPWGGGGGGEIHQGQEYWWVSDRGTGTQSWACAEAVASDKAGAHWVEDNVLVFTESY